MPSSFDNFDDDTQPTHPMQLISRQLRRAERLVGPDYADTAQNALVDTLTTLGEADEANNVPLNVSILHQHRAMIDFLKRLRHALDSLEYS